MKVRLPDNIPVRLLKLSSLHDDLNQYDFSASEASQVCYLVT
jgi:hypothetical protein